MFQAIEQSLRLILPYMHPDGSKKGLDAMREYVESISNKSLGVLIGQFNEAMSGDKDLIAPELKALVDARNDLVHHFYRNTQFDLLAPDAAERALAYLDAQHHQAREWAELFRVQAGVVLLAIMETSPKAAAEFGQYRDRLIAQLPDSLKGLG